MRNVRPKSGPNLFAALGQAQELQQDTHNHHSWLRKGSTKEFLQVRDWLVCTPPYVAAGDSWRGTWNKQRRSVATGDLATWAPLGFAHPPAASITGIGGGGARGRRVPITFPTLVRISVGVPATWRKWNRAATVCGSKPERKSNQFGVCSFAVTAWVKEASASLRSSRSWPWRISAKAQFVCDVELLGPTIASGLRETSSSLVEQREDSIDSRRPTKISLLEDHWEGTIRKQSSLGLEHERHVGREVNLLVKHRRHMDFLMIHGIALGRWPPWGERAPQEMGSLWTEQSWRQGARQRAATQQRNHSKRHGAFATRSQREHWRQLMRWDRQRWHNGTDTRGDTEPNTNMEGSGAVSVNEV